MSTRAKLLLDGINDGKVAKPMPGAKDARRERMKMKKLLRSLYIFCAGFPINCHSENFIPLLHAPTSATASLLTPTALWAAFLSLLILLVPRRLHRPKNAGLLNLPPGPPGWPIVSTWARLHAPYGARTLIVVSGADLAHEALIEQGPLFASRPSRAPHAHFSVAASSLLTPLPTAPPGVPFVAIWFPGRWAELPYESFNPYSTGRGLTCGPNPGGVQCIIP
uniref:Uncharacterized protein n=1 Tax=Ananas comosus var. bracteatus TaxID=296719 RepID=A0A6V7P2F4_ANACO|nr:unnamed protein product [Ananas comosus var. bracteatus]